MLAVAAVGVVIGVFAVSQRAPDQASATAAPAAPIAGWAAGERRAPAFSLRDQLGVPVSLDQFRGRPVIVTFLDPLCRSLCPLEARALGTLESILPLRDRPAIVAVSVNPWGNAPANLQADLREWHVSTNWHWAVGSRASLQEVWASYKIAVADSAKTIDGVTVHDVTHTEAAYLLDRRGYERALYVYPFAPRDVAAGLRQLAASG